MQSTKKKGKYTINSGSHQKWLKRMKCGQTPMKYLPSKVKYLMVYISIFFHGEAKLYILIPMWGLTKVSLGPNKASISFYVTLEFLRNRYPSKINILEATIASFVSFTLKNLTIANLPSNLSLL